MVVVVRTSEGVKRKHPAFLPGILVRSTALDEEKEGTLHFRDPCLRYKLTFTAARFVRVRALTRTETCCCVYAWQLSCPVWKCQRSCPQTHLRDVQRWSESLFFTPAPKKVTPAPVPELIGSLHSETPTPVHTLESRVYFATWAKITAWTILPLANMDEYCHAFNAGKQVVLSCLCWSTAGFP